MTTTDVEGFWAALKENPDDWLTRSAMADWHEEQGNTETAAAIRWMVKHQKRAYRGAMLISWFQIHENSSADCHSDLPVALWEKLQGGELTPDLRNTSVYFIGYSTRREAEEAFCAAWIAAVKDGWNPEA